MSNISRNNPVQRHIGWMRIWKYELRELYSRYNNRTPIEKIEKTAAPELIGKLFKLFWNTETRCAVRWRAPPHPRCGCTRFYTSCTRQITKGSRHSNPVFSEFHRVLRGGYSIERSHAQPFKARQRLLFFLNAQAQKGLSLCLSTLNFYETWK